jgi:NADP-dependent 3-hydroxy acid dehydrogenase YdfG
MKLNTSTAIITGATRGLGAAIAEALVKKGASVYGLARSIDALNNIKSKLSGQFIPVQVDVTELDEVKDWVHQTFKESSAPDILINNAGVGYFGKVDELPVEKWRRMIDTNLSGMFYLTQTIVPFMKQKKTPSYIINIGSILGTLGNPKMSAYCATKFGTRGFSEALFKELRYDGIKVSCLNPGSIETDFFAESGIKKHSNMLQPKDIAETVLYMLQTPDNMLISGLTIRPLNPRKKA